jgi:hypothetical protein
MAHKFQAPIVITFTVILVSNTAEDQTTEEMHYFAALRNALLASLSD